MNDKIIQFIKETECGITIPGIFDLPRGVFAVALSEYLLTGKNNLNRYIKLVHLRAEIATHETFTVYWDSKRRQEIIDIIANEEYWDISAILTDSDIEKIDIRISHWERYEAKKKGKG